MLGGGGHRRTPGVSSALPGGLRHNAPLSRLSQQPRAHLAACRGTSDDRLIPRRVDGGVTLRKYDSAIIRLGPTGPEHQLIRRCGVDMATVEGAHPAGIVAVSRAVVSAAAELVAGVERAVVGDANVRTAQRNAWAAIQADR